MYRKFREIPRISKKFASSEQIEAKEQKERVRKLISDCRQGACSAFAVLKDVGFKRLNEDFFISEVEYNGWEQKYNFWSQTFKG